MSKKKASKQLEELLTEKESLLTDDDQIKDLLKAAEQFNELVEQGLAQKRGYTLMTPDQVHLHRIGINMPND